MSDKAQSELLREELDRRRREQEERLGAEAERLRDHEQQLFAHERPPDVASPRAKSTGHGKKTADKWNQ